MLFFYIYYYIAKIYFEYKQYIVIYNQINLIYIFNITYFLFYHINLYIKIYLIIKFNFNILIIY